MIGRQPYRALVSLTHSDGDFPAALFQFGDLDGTNWYYNISATCLTPGSKAAIVTKVDDLGGYVFSLEMTPWDFGGSQAAAWEPGVHLFSIMMWAPGGHQSGTIATVVVPAKKKQPLKLTELSVRRMMSQSRTFAQAQVSPRVRGTGG
jgi:hypothetical protein